MSFYRLYTVLLDLVFSVNHNHYIRALERRINYYDVVIKRKSHFDNKAAKIVLCMSVHKFILNLISYKMYIF